MHDTPSDQDKQDDLLRQYENVRAGIAPSIFCPWCFKANVPDKPACCGFFKEGVDKIGRDQFNSVLKQWKEVKLGAARSLRCPYCGTWVKKADEDTHPGEWVRPLHSPFCCDLLADAATAIVERELAQRLAEDKKRIEDRMVSN